MFRFVLTILVVTGLAIGLVLILVPQPPSFLYPTSVLLAFATILLYRYLHTQKNPQFFVQLYLATMAFKLLVYCGYALTIAMLDKPGAFANVVYFLCVYVLFTALEVVFLYHKISRPNR